MCTHIHALVLWIALPLLAPSQGATCIWTEQGADLHQAPCSCKDLDSCSNSQTCEANEGRAAHPSGSLMKARPFMLPPSGFFTKSTPSFSKRSHAAYTSGTESPMCPAQEKEKHDTFYSHLGLIRCPTPLGVRIVIYA